MPAAIRAGVLYFAIVFTAGFLLGALRVFIILPIIGGLAAVALELPVILFISWLACRKLVTQLSVPALASHRIAMGASAFAMLMLAELALSVLVFSRSGPEFLADLRTPPGLLGLAGQIAFALLPLAQLKKLI
jgi:hypothetical protein